MNSRLQRLQAEHSKQQELVYNADFKLHQMERKVARGLGERSDVEKEKLSKRIDILKEEQKTNVERNKHLSQQCKILQQELKRCGRKRDQCDSDKRDIQRLIDEVELEIASCDLNLQKLCTDKEEDMVSLDLVRLEVRRLRDILNSRATEVYKLQDIGEELNGRMNQRKHELSLKGEVWTAQLRAAEEERHRCKIELGQRTIAAEKMQMKYEMITKAHNTGDSGEEGEGRSHVYYLIAAAQKRADLQREGDSLDAEIRKKEKELKAMGKTLAHLKGRNTDFRQSFAKIDRKGTVYKDICKLEEDMVIAEDNLFDVKQSMHEISKKCKFEKDALSQSEKQLCTIKEENEHLDTKKKSIELDIQQLAKETSTTSDAIIEER